VLARQSEKSVFWHEGHLATRTPSAQDSSPYWSEYAASGFLLDPDSAITASQMHESLETRCLQCLPVDCRFVARLWLFAAAGQLAMPDTRLEDGGSFLVDRFWREYTKGDWYTGGTGSVRTAR
jgi:hypothetical protein